MAENEITPEQREEMRNAGMFNLQNKNLVTLGIAYLIEQSKEFGEVIKDSNYNRFIPALNSVSSEVINSSLESSRKEGKRFSGTVSEESIAEKCAMVVMNAINNIKVEDILHIIGSEADVLDRYKGRYVSELDTEYKSKVIGAYQSYLVMNEISASVMETTRNQRDGLVKILSESE
jgi:hypothetical protein